MAQSLSAKSLKIFNYIVGYKQKHDGRSPSFREIQEFAGYKTISAVSNQVLLLTSAGLITVDENYKSRCISVVDGEWRYNPPTGDKLVTLVLENERPPTWNKVKRLNKYMYSSLVREKKWLIIAEYYANYGRGADPFDVPVDIDIVVWFDRHPYDSDNIAAKLYIDGLHGLVIVNDTPRYMRRVSTLSCVDPNDPRVQISIYPSVL